MSRARVTFIFIFICITSTNSIYISVFLFPSLQVQSKASTISSGARAAAQTLNVPIERLEAQVHSNSSGKPSPSGGDHGGEHFAGRTRQNGRPSNVTSRSPDKIIADEITVAHQQEHMTKSQHHGDHGKNGFVNGGGNQLADSPHHLDRQNDSMHHMDHTDDNDEHASSLVTTPAKYSLLQFAMQHFGDE